MRRGDAALLLAGVAAATFWVARSDTMLRYVRPSMRVPLLVSAGLLGLLALAVAMSARSDARPTDEDEHGGGHGGAAHGLRLVGWLVAVPLVVAAGLDPGALGAYTAARQAGYGPPSVAFDLEEHLRTRSFGGQPAELALYQLSVAADGDDAERGLLARTPVRLTGFVLDTHEGGFGLARLMVGCCAGDATAVVVEVTGVEGPPPEVDSWLEVVGRFDPEASASAEDRTGGRADSPYLAPVVQAESVRPVDAPDAPYEYPG